MGLFRAIFRWFFLSVLIGLVLSITFGVVGQFFIRWAAENGWYDKPSERVGAALNWIRIVTGVVQSFTLQTWFLCLVSAFGGLTIGAWIDHLLRRIDRRVGAAKTLDNLFADGVASRNELIPAIQNFNLQTAEAKMADWNDRVLAILDRADVSIRDRSRFRTLNLFLPSFHSMPGKGPPQDQMEAIWNEKLRQLRRIIDRLA